jgi:integrase
MASVQDRWYAEQKDADGQIVRTATARNGTGKRWRVRYRTPSGDERNRSFARKVDADRFAINAESSKMAGTYVDPVRAKITVGEMAAKWTASKSGLEKSTQSTYSNVMDDHVLPRWKTIPLAAVEFEDVQAWIAELVASGLSGAHVRKIHFVLGGVLQLAVKGKRLPANPAKGVDLPRAKSKDKKYLNVEEVEAMAAAAGAVARNAPRRGSFAGRDQYRLAVYVLAYCGLRWSEIAAMRVYSVDLRRRRMHVKAAVVEVDHHGLVWGTPKSHEARWVPIPGFLADELNPYLARKLPDDLLFTAPDGGVMRNRNARRGWFNRAALEAGAPSLTPHELRHTAASLAVRAGANVKALQRMLGHASAAITLDIYADLFDDDLDAVGGSLDALRRNSLVAPMRPGGPSGGPRSTPENATGPGNRGL